jgi:hypothetical protein
MLAMLFWVLAALAVVGALAVVWGLYLLVVWGLYLLARRSGFSSEPRAGVDTQKTSPARKWRAMGRIERQLLDEGRALRPNRPKNLRPQPHPTTRSDRCFYLSQRAGTPRTPACQERFLEVGPNR